MTFKRKDSHASLVTIFLVIFIDLIGFGIVLPLLPLYAEAYGASPFVIGLLAVSFSAMQFIFNPIWGRISDRVGRRPILLMSLIGSVISYAILGWAPSLFWLFISRIAAGIFAANISTAMAYIADVTSPENRSKGMGLIGAAFGLGFIFGPGFGGLLSRAGEIWSQGFRFSLPGYGAALFSAIALLLTIFKLPESLTALDAGRSKTATQKFSLRSYFKPIGRAVRQPEVARPLLVYFLVVFAVANMQMTFPLFTKAVYNFDVMQNGFLFAFIGIIAAVLQGGLIGRLSKGFGDGPLAILGTVLSMVALTLIPFAITVPLLVGVLAILGIGSGLNTPTLTSLVSVGTESSLQGGVMGVNRAISSLARILGPLWGGWSYGALGINWPYWTAGVFLFFAVLIGIPLWHKGPVGSKEILIHEGIQEQSS
ncbi:MAG: MFS transporter [bacterium]